MNGNEAKKAWGEGHEIQFAYEEHIDEKTWALICDDDPLSIFKRRGVVFRIKPRTIKIGEYEVPAPFEPEVGDTVFFISSSDGKGWDFMKFNDSSVHRSLIQYGAWRTQEEIVQVVPAVRSVLNGW